eukprot:TRINITY_DN9738_c0_g8_i1.p1 TRINITY_DN9738_c0_g8~~TRINITY_DN9738_c0_g8_i1.p1  ORF type:complete len:201 (-),score=19.36 TRINITY_DN9738_c0_g8_i1:45-647(-)
MRLRASIQDPESEPQVETLGMALPWELPYSRAEAVPWDQEDSQSRSKERENILALTKALRGNVRSKYTGSAELVFKPAGPSHNPESMRTQVGPRVRSLRFESGTMTSHDKTRQATKARAKQQGLALSWPVTSLTLNKVSHRHRLLDRPTTSQSPGWSFNLNRDQDRMKPVKLRASMRQANRRPSSAHEHRPNRTPTTSRT